MKNAGRKQSQVWRIFAMTLAAGMVSSAFAQSSSDEKINFGGYVRLYLGWNAGDPIEVSGKNNRWRQSMQREQLYVEADQKKSNFQWKVSARVVAEQATSYLKDIQNLDRTRMAGRDPNFDIQKLYTNSELREAWIQFQPNDVLNFKIGKQQVAWGETDGILHPLDTIHGYNLTWAPFFEEFDEFRKPLFLINTTLQVPEADGSLQLVVRPGLDAENDLGSTWDMKGGRARPSGVQGFSSWNGFGDDWNHPDSRKNDVTWALRWKGKAAGLGYHLSYINTFYTGLPILNSFLAPNQKVPINKGGGPLSGNYVSPKIDVFGVGVNGYAQGIDTVLTGEMVYTKGKPYNQGSIPGGPLALNCLGPVTTLADASSLSGFCGYKRKNTLDTVFRAEKPINTSALGSSGPTSVGVQFVNTAILNFNSADELVASLGYPDLAHKNTNVGTIVVRTPWLGDKLTSSIFYGREFTDHGNFGAFVLDYELGTNWRLRAEYDYYSGRNSVKTTGNILVPDGQLYQGGAAGRGGALQDSDMFVTRITYQF